MSQSTNIIILPLLVEYGTLASLCITSPYPIYSIIIKCFLYLWNHITQCYNFCFKYKTKVRKSTGEKKSLLHLSIFLLTVSFLFLVFQVSASHYFLFRELPLVILLLLGMLLRSYFCIPSPENVLISASLKKYILLGCGSS